MLSGSKKKDHCVHILTGLKIYSQQEIKGARLEEINNTK